MYREFQSSPAPKGRCNYADHLESSTDVMVHLGFNPHRPRRAGATASRFTTMSVRRDRLARFQSSPAPKGRCNTRMVRQAA